MARKLITLPSRYRRRYLEMDQLEAVEKPDSEDAVEHREKPDSKDAVEYREKSKRCLSSHALP